MQDEWNKGVLMFSGKADTAKHILHILAPCIQKPPLASSQSATVSYAGMCEKNGVVIRQNS
jgi:hypothetical protein